MAAKNGYYYELNCLEWLDSNIAYEKASIRIAWLSIRCLFFVSLNNDEELYLKRAVKHKDLSKEKILYLIKKGYIEVTENKAVHIPDVFENVKKIKKKSEIGRSNAFKRWHNQEVEKNY